MLTSLDPHSSFLTADDFDQMQTRTRGEFGGLGIGSQWKTDLSK